MAGRNLTPTNKTTACPVCGDRTGKCRVSRDENLVLCLSSAGDDWRVDGYRALGDTKNGTWAKYRRCDETYDPDVAARKREAWAARERARIAALPSLAARHETIARKLRRGLSAEHERKLRSRGLSAAAIERCGFYSFQGGIAGGVRGIDGRYVAVVYRLDDPDEGGRYRWGKDSQLPGTGELPIALYEPAGDAGSSAGVLYLCEGSIVKPAIVSERLGATVLGYGGGSGDLSRIAPQLRTFCETFQPREIRILPDAGWRANPQVRRANESLAEICRTIAPTRIGDWGQADDKAIGDIDEIAGERLAAIAWVDAVNATEATPEAEVASGKPQPNTQAWRNWRKAKRFTPDVAVEQRYLDVAAPQAGEILAVRSGTGTGKTTWYLDGMAAAADDRGHLFFGYRNSLLTQTGAKIEARMPHRKAYHLQRDLKADGGEALAILRDPSSIVLSCIDSVTRFKPEDADGKDIAIDEAESVIAHLLESGTSVARYRTQAQHVLAEIARRARSLTLLDGHLRDETVHYVANLAGGTKRVRAIENTYRGNKGTLQLLAGTSVAELSSSNAPDAPETPETPDGSAAIKVRDYSPIQNAILAHRGRICVASDSQQRIETLDRLLQEAGRTTLRFDSTTSGSEWAEEFLADPSAYLLKHQPDALLYTPSAEAGLDISLRGYFQDLYFLFFGVVGVDACLQMLARVRDPEARKSVFIETCGLGGAAGANWAGKTGTERAQELMALALDCSRESFALDTEAWIAQATAWVVETAGNRHFQHSCELAAIAEFERQHLREAFVEAAERSGYAVETVVATPDRAGLTAKADATRAEIRQERCTALLNAPTVTPQEASQIAGNINASPMEKASLAKHRILEQFPGIEEETYEVAGGNSDSDSGSDSGADAGSATDSEADKVDVEAGVEADIEAGVESRPVFDAEFIERVTYKDRGLALRYELRWLMLHLDEARQLQRQKWIGVLEKAFDPIEPRGLGLAKYRSPLLAAKALVELGLPQFLEAGFEWNAESPAVRALYGKLRRSRRLQRDAGINPGKATPVELVGRLLRKLGLRTRRRQVARGVFSYGLVTTPIDGVLMRAVGRRMAARLESQRTLQVARERVTARKGCDRLPSGSNTFSGEGVHAESQSQQGVRGFFEVSLDWLRDRAARGELSAAAAIAVRVLGSVPRGGWEVWFGSLLPEVRRELMGVLT